MINMQQKGGIVFFQTQMLEKLHTFYINTVGCELWLDQGGCQIFRHGNMLFGFCQRNQTDQDALITFYYENKSEVDDMYSKVKNAAEAKPLDNPDYRIYHFYAADPEGRRIEFQYFWDEKE